MSQRPLGPKYSAVNTDEAAVLEEAVEATYGAMHNESDPLASLALEEDSAWLKEQRLTHQSLHWLKRPTVIMIGICLFMVAFAASSAESTRQLITFKLACNSVAAEMGTGDVCDPAQTQILVLSLQQAYIIAVGCTTIFSLGKLGPLSDQYGRRLFIGLIVLFQAVGKLVKYFVITSGPELRFLLMVLTEILASLCGGVMTLVMLANCYVSDISEPHQRTYFLGIIMALLFVGLSLGPAVGNVLISLTNRMGVFARDISKVSTSAMTAVSGKIPREELVPLKVEIGLLFLVLLFICTVLPESRTQSARRMSRSLSRLLLQASLTRPDAPEAPSARPGLLSMVNFLRPLRLLAYPKDQVAPLRYASIRTTRVAVILLVLFDCLFISVMAPMGEVFVMYGVYRFDWTAQDIGLMLVVTCLFRAITLLVLSPILSHKLFLGYFGLRTLKKRYDHVEWAVVTTGLLADSMGMLLLGLSPSLRMFIGVMAISSIGLITTPAVNSALVKFYPEQKVGELFSAMALLKNTLQIVVPYLVLGIYKKTVTHGIPQLLFFIVAIIVFIGLLVLTWVIYILDKEDARVARVAEAEAEMEEELRRQVHHRNSSFSAGA